MADFTADRRTEMIEIAAGSDTTIALNPLRLYTISHSGLDSAGAESLGALHGKDDGSAVVVDYADGTGKFFILSGESFPLPPDSSLISLQAEVAAVTIRLTSTRTRG